MGSMCDNGTEWIVPVVQTIDYMPEEGQIDGVDAVPLPAAAIARLREGAVAARNKEVRQNNVKKPQFFAYLFKLMSSESALQIESHSDYHTAYQNSDPHLLWQIIMYTHLTHVNGARPEMVELTRSDEEDKHHSLMQGKNESIGDFLNRLTNSYTILIAAGSTAFTDQQKAIQFLKKLDQSRHGNMLADMKNRAQRGEPLPATLYEAYTIASHWLVKKGPGQFAYENHTVYLADVTGRGGRGRSRGGRGGRGNGRESPKVPFVEKRRCYNCDEYGHLAKDCPEEAKKESSQRVAVVTTTLPNNDPSEEFDDDSSVTSGAYAYVMTHSSETPASHVLALHGTKKNPNVVYLDNGATASIFGNRDLLHDMFNPSVNITVEGFSRNSALKVESKGHFKELGPVWHHKDVTVNVLSQSSLVDTGCKVTYDHLTDIYDIKPFECDFSYKFTRENGNGLYSLTCNRHDAWSKYSRKPHIGEGHHFQYFKGQVLFATVIKNQTFYSDREVKNAAIARHFMAKMGADTSKAAKAMIKSMKNCPVNDRDIDIADFIYGSQPYDALMGHANSKKSPAIMMDLLPIKVQVQQHGFIDIMFVAPLAFLVLVVKPLNMTFCQALDGEDFIVKQRRSKSNLSKVLFNMLAGLKSRGFIVQIISCDGEKSISAMIPELNSNGHIVSITAAGSHVAVVEKKIQDAKKKLRRTLNCLPFSANKVILLYATYFSIGNVNNHISSRSLDQISPRQRFTGRMLDMKLDVRFEFGAYCHATVPNTNNSMDARTDACICLLSAYNLTGSVKMFDLNTKAIVTRDNFVLLPMPSSVISYLNSLARADGINTIVRFNGGNEVITDDSNQLPNYIYPADVLQDDVQVDQPAQPDPIGGDVVVADAASIDDVLSDSVATGVDAHRHNLEQAVNDDATLQQPDIVPPLPIQECPIVPADVPPVVPPVVPPRIIPGSHIRDMFRGRAPIVNQHALHISVRAALREFPTDAMRAITSELSQMISKKVWTPIIARQLTQDQRRSVIRSSMFITEKKDPSGAFLKLKARLVAGGDQQDKTLYNDISAATAATSSVFMVAAIAAREKRLVTVVDITCAYLNAKMSNQVVVHMKLNKTLTNMLVDMDDSYTRYINNDGGCIVRLDRALYGCVESAALWADHIKGSLMYGGFTQNPHDICCYNKMYDNVQITVIIHVDDLLITCINQTYIDILTDLLISIYKDIRAVSGRVVGYLGLSFNFMTEGQVTITAPGFMKDLLTTCRSPGYAVSPATEHLFQVREDAPVPVPTTADCIYFHSTVAKLLYLAKRTRPDILVTIAFLTTRVTKCDSDDMSKLHRVMSYLNRTADRGVTLRIGNGPIIVRCYIDAAYAVHQDAKSHTGCCVILGESGSCYMKSAKQKIVTKSSTEAELVALSDSANVPIHMSRFLAAQGHDVPPAILYQDNKSAMALISKGRSTSDLTRHISLRYFWVKEKIKDGTFQIRYCPSKTMWANGLTKPTQGQQFKDERAEISGFYE
jgi:hypothetical protein